MNRITDYDPIAAYITSVVVIRGLSATPIELPPVVGCSLAAGIAQSIRSDFPQSTVSIAGSAQGTLDGLTEAISISDETQRLWAEAMSGPRPGERLLVSPGLICVKEVA